MKKLKAGESFDLLVGMHSQGPAAKAGGDLGFMEKGMMFPAVDEAAFRMKTGEISDVIESPIGFHIISREEESLYRDTAVVSRHSQNRL